MPCGPQRAKKLLKSEQAKVVRKTPFTIQLKFGSTGHKQDLAAGMDTGSRVVGTAVTTKKGKVLYQAEAHLRGEEIKSKMETRSVYRRTRRGRKTRYRKPRGLNRDKCNRDDFFRTIALEIFTN